MDKNIGIGILVGLTFTSTIFILNSSYFTKNQKTFLGILFLFPPGQWILGIIIGLWNKQNNTINGVSMSSLKKQISQLESLKNQGLLTEDEFEIKTNKIYEKKLTELFENSKEYKNLKNLRDNNILTEQEFENKYVELFNRF